MKKIFMAFDQYAGMCERLGNAIKATGRQYDAIVCLARGGMLVGDILSRILKLPLGVLVASSYEENGIKTGKVLISDVAIVDRSKMSGNILLVDDLVDSGVTIQKVKDELTSKYGCSVNVGVLWWKSTSECDPDFWVKYLPETENCWIVQPFEMFED